MKKALLIFCVLFFSSLCFAERRDALSIEGTWTYSFSYDNRTCNLRGDRVVNRSPYGRPFRLTFFLSKYPYYGGTIYGFEVGSSFYNSLNAGWQYNDLNLCARQFCHEQPPSGVYYPVILVLESNGGVDGVVDYLAFREPLYFRNHYEASLGNCRQPRPAMHFAREASIPQYDSISAAAGSDSTAQIIDGIGKIAESMAKIIVITTSPPPLPRDNRRAPRPPRR